MYLAVDVGGTKTLVANFDNHGTILYKDQFPTSRKYNDFLSSLAKSIQKIGNLKSLKACACAIPAVEFDRSRGIAESFGNLSWKNVPIKKDLEGLLPGLSIAVENDAKLAGLYEALTLKDFKKLLYITIGTGVGVALVTNGVIDTEIGDAGGRGILLHLNKKIIAWDDISSGHALSSQYGLKASEIEDPKIWQDYVKNLAIGIDLLVGITQPDVVVIGGGVGAHFDKFGHFLREELRKYETGKLKVPPIKQAVKPEEAVIYGCYAYARQSS